MEFSVRLRMYMLFMWLLSVGKSAVTAILFPSGDMAGDWILAV